MPPYGPVAVRIGPVCFRAGYQPKLALVPYDYFVLWYSFGLLVHACICFVRFTFFITVLFDWLEKAALK